MIPQRKKPGALEPSTGRKTNMVSDPRDSSSPALSPQEIVARLRRYLELAKRSRLTLDGEVGCAMLDCLELAKELRDEVRSQAKELLLREPGLIPHWSAKESAPARELSRDSVVVFERLHEADPALTARLFLQACAPTLSGVLKLQYALNPGLQRPAVEAQVEEILEGLIKLREPRVRLVRTEALPI